MADEKEQNRSKLSLDLDDIPSNNIPPVDPVEIEAVSEKSGFSKREKVSPVVETVKPSSSSQRKRRTTGRTHPFNTKIKPAAHQMLIDMSDKLSEREDRPVSMAEVLERALLAMNATLNDE